MAVVICYNSTNRFHSVCMRIPVVLVHSVVVVKGLAAGVLESAVLSLNPDSAVKP